MKDNKKSKIYSCASQATITQDLHDLMNFQEKGISLKELKEKIDNQLVPHLVQYNRPEFHSLYNFFPENGAEFGAKIALKYNQGVTNWQVSPGAVMVEELCCQAMCKMLGYTAEEMLQKGVGEISPPERRAQARQLFDSLATVEKVFIPEIPALRKDGKTIYCSINSVRETLNGEETVLGFFRE